METTDAPFTYDSLKYKDHLNEQTIWCWSKKFGSFFAVVIDAFNLIYIRNYILNE